MTRTHRKYMLTRAWLAAAFFGLFGLVAVIGPDIEHGRVPGDYGDSRFNNYVLEHGYQWITFQVKSFWTSCFYYPFPLTTAFSSNNLGSLPVYAVLRGIGFDREDSFSGWYILGYVINFLACGYALRKMSLNWLAVGMGTFLFSFGLPVMEQTGHAQLLYRFGVPLAILSIIKFEELPRLSSIFWIVFWLSWQFYCEIYNGYFLSLLLAAYILSNALLRGYRESGPLSYWSYRVRTAWSSATVKSRVTFVFGILILLLMLANLFTPYIEASQLYGFKRTWDEIVVMLPRLASYLLSNNSHIWRMSWSEFDALPMRHEHAMFFGAALFLAFGLAMLLRLSGRAALHPLVASAALSLFLLLSITLWINGASVYRFLAVLPGVNSIRAVTRICLVMLFPASMILAFSVDALSTARISILASFAARAMLSVVLLIECSDITHHTSLKSDWRSRVQAAADELPKNLPDSPILLFGPRFGEDPSWRDIDAMLLTQERGWATLNGYTGNVPPGHVITGSCQDAAADIVGALDFLGNSGEKGYEQVADRVVLVGFPDCDHNWISSRPRITNFAGPLPADLMAKTHIKIESVSTFNSAPVALLTISNQGNQSLPARSLTGMPVRISAQYIPVDHFTRETLLKVHWDSRQILDVDIPAGTSLKVNVPLPIPPSDEAYVVVISLVQDGVAWFHNQGMQIAVSSQTVTVRDSKLLIDQVK